MGGGERGTRKWVSLGHSRNLPSSRKHGGFPEATESPRDFSNSFLSFLVPVFSSNSLFPVHFNCVSFFVVS